MTADRNHDEEWEDIVRRLGGSSDQARSEPIAENPATSEAPSQPSGPRDFTVADEIVEDFQPPDAKPIATGNPRTLLSWTAVIGAVATWLLAALLGIQLSWLVATITAGAFLAGGISLFFLIPQTRGHDGLDDDDYGNGAKL